MSRIAWIARMLVLGGVLSLGVQSIAAAGEASERARLSQERRDVDARFDMQERECQQRFLVTACTDDVRRARRDALAEVNARLLALDDAAREQRTEARRRSVEKKTARRAAAASAAAASASSPP